jgi:hypothetical protein
MDPALLGRIGGGVPLPVGLRGIDRAVRLGRDPPGRQGLRDRRVADPAMRCIIILSLLFLII